MKIKDLRQFRTLFKKEIREIDSRNRNEHFIGVRKEVEGKSEYGFFEIYHGAKEGYGESDGIRGFLEGFLDMAKDGQAVYEFMQNAVDARSTKFCLFWGTDEVDGHDYLLVANNGSMFDMDSIQSILNVGVSTKSSNSQTIGKFGIGFKLAHRLVGRENGLDELLHQNYGPIMFSWQQNEILKLSSFETNPEVFPQAQQYRIQSLSGKRKATIQSTDPWLLKILITNFPCMPENEVVPEIIRDNQFIERNNAFSKDELKALGRWVGKHQEFLKEGFIQGSLFFVRLGQGKQSHLSEDNLEEGVKFSLAILNRIAGYSLQHDGLKQVYLQEKFLEPVALDFESFIINKAQDADDYKFIRFGKTTGLSEAEEAKLLAEGDIEILLGYTEHKNSEAAFRNAPNFYLYFPLSEEKHRFRFMLHSNAFYKSSSRTYLQKGSIGDEGINERLFRVFVRSLGDRMLWWSNSYDNEQREKYLKLYANLLLSEESVNPERVWVNNPLWAPILAFIKIGIPIKFKATYQLNNIPDKIRIITTKLPVDNENWLGTKYDWFYWTEEDDFSLCSNARVKLNIKNFSIVDLLQEQGVSEKINEWLVDKSVEIIDSLLAELDRTITSTKPNDTFWENFSKLKIWKFPDAYFSIEELGDEKMYDQRLLLFDTLDPIKAQLTKAGYILSDKSLSDFNSLALPIQNRYQAVIKYIRKHEELIKVLNLRIGNAELNHADKVEIVRTLAKKLSDEKEDRINKLRELCLFRNKQGLTAPLKSLLKSSHNIPWLDPWVIRIDESNSLLDEYLASTPADIYKNIIIPYWDQLVGSATNQDGVRSVFDYAKGHYKQDNTLPKLTNLKIIAVDNAFISLDENYYFSAALSLLTENEYESLRSIGEKIGIGSMPSYFLRNHYKEVPFELPEKSLKIDDKGLNVTANSDEINALLKLCTAKLPDVFSILFIEPDETEGIFRIRKKQEGIFQVDSNLQGVREYVSIHHNFIFRFLPEQFTAHASLLPLHGDKFLKRLLHDCDLSNEKQLNSLIGLISQANSEMKRELLNKIPSVAFDLTKPLNKELLPVCLLQLAINASFPGDEVQKWIKSKISILHGGETILLSKAVLLGSEEIIFEGFQNPLSLSTIIIDNDSHATKAVGELITELVKLELGDKRFLETMFGLTGQTSNAYLLEQITSRYADIPLDNAHQLAFVLISAFKNRQPLNFKVSTQKNIVPLDNIVLYTPDCNAEFLPEELLLSEKYNGIDKLLFNTGASIFKCPQHIAICKEPYIEGELAIIPGVKEVGSESRVQLINFFYNKWKELPEQPKILRLGNDSRWSSLLGFDPMLTIHGSELIHGSEKLPEDLVDWLKQTTLEVNSAAGSEFLKALGVSFSGADIIRVRKYLIGVDLEQPSINYSIPPSLIINTFQLLESKNILFTVNEKRTELIRELYTRVAENADINTPLPVISTAEVNSFVIKTVTEAKILDSSSLASINAKGFILSELPAILNTDIVLEYLIKGISKVNSSTRQLSFEFGKIDFEKVQTESSVWSARFYSEWNNTAGIEIITVPGELPRLLTTEGQIIHRYREGQIEKIGNVIIANGELDDKKIISLLREKQYLSPSEIDELETLHEKYQQMVQDYMSKIQSRPELLEAWKELEKKLKEVEKKKQLSEDFGSSQKYSYSWFMNLLDLMVITGEGKDLEDSEGEIVFGKVQINPMDLRVITLSDPSKSISPNIEMYTDFKATFIFRSSGKHQIRKEIQIKGISKKGQRLYALPANEQELANITDTTVQCVEFKFTRVIDLINRLTKAFRSLSLGDDANLKSELTNNIRFIFGPPGTGKTTHLAKLVIEKISRKQVSKILILTPTNKAADVLVKRILKLAEEQEGIYPDGWLARFGTSADLELLDRRIVYDANTFELNVYEQCVLVTTIHRFPYEQIVAYEGGLKTPLAEIDWDTIIFDEASMIMLPSIVYPLFKKKFIGNTENLTEFIIGGDPLQIPPVFDLPDEDLPESQKDVKEENIYSMVGLKSFKTEEQSKIPVFGEKIHNLETQYRSIEAIGKLFSKFQYHNRLNHGRNQSLGGSPNPRELPSYFKELGFKPITVIRYPVNTLDSIYKPEKLNKSPFQLFSAFLVNELVKKFRMEIGAEEWNIGVICPYRSQASLLNKMIESHTQKPNLTVISDTVHGFQGDECDLVFAVFNPSSARSQYSLFLQKEYIINVAISRAKDYLILLLPDDETEGLNGLRLIHEVHQGSLLNIIRELPKESVAQVSAKEIERKLMGVADYFATNSFTNVHQTVNVYGQPEMDYMVRVSGNAIDIHWKNQS
jgi:hypothetical protein